ncbi:methyltransferase domain protein [Streptomyces himastatinicus ATCC 53653]|uniref:Methyltransferase domain protein n=1 Tax=Streptomyces himastatinicus ATCC 53653 TaxID=457427 RepID=D9WU00_9ACTN|nr:methyltransferase [Streptomyces himastatinicus]EFL22248.1 methyltransferase domain protein [Streptomyces himastatinicus ATCC 53653]
MYDYTQPLSRSEASRAEVRQQTDIELSGKEWTLLPDVFSPAHSKSSLAHLSLLEFPVGGTFLEIGSGIGLIAVEAALAGCRAVYATDLNPAAVKNTELNAERFGVADRVTAVHSDLFDALHDAPAFDVVYWHSNNVWAPPELDLTAHELAYVDPGYEAHRRYFREARNHLAPGGRVLIALSSRAGRPELDELAAADEQRLITLDSTTVDEPEGPVVYELLELVTR